MKETARRQSIYPILDRIDYAPTPEQEAFHISAALHPAFIGGYGSGKTYACVMKALALAELNTGCTGMILSPTYRMADDVVYPMLCSILSENAIEHTALTTRHNILLPASDARIILRSADRPERIKGLNLAWAFLDEAAIMDKNAWLVTLSRVRDRSAFVTQCGVATTPEGLNWVYEEWHENRRPGHELITASTRSNVHLAEGYLASMLASYDAATARQYVDGEFVETRGRRVYYAFGQNRNVRDERFDPAGPVHIGIDFNVAPMVAVVVQERGAALVAVAELAIDDNADTARMARMIAERFAQAPQILLYPDASGANRRTSGKSDIAILKSELPRAVFRHGAKNPAVRDRLNAVNLLLAPPNGAPGLFINAAECPLLFKDLKHLKWNADGTKIDKNDPTLSHASDALGYAVVQLRPVAFRRASSDGPVHLY